MNNQITKDDVLRMRNFTCTICDQNIRDYGGVLSHYITIHSINDILEAVVQATVQRKVNDDIDLQ